MNPLSLLTWLLPLAKGRDGQPRSLWHLHLIAYALLLGYCTYQTIRGNTLEGNLDLASKNAALYESSAASALGRAEQATSALANALRANKALKAAEEAAVRRLAKAQGDHINQTKKEALTSCQEAEKVLYDSLYQP